MGFSYCPYFKLEGWCYQRNLVTGMGEVEGLPVPRTCKGFKTQVFEQYQRRQAELDEAICDMFVSGGSTVQVGQVVEKLTRTKPSPSTVSRVFHGLEDEFDAWKKRPLAPEYLYADVGDGLFEVEGLEVVVQQRLVAPR